MKVVNKVALTIGRDGVNNTDIKLQPMTCFIVDSISRDSIALRFNNKGIKTDLDDAGSWLDPYVCHENKGNSIINVLPDIFKMFFIDVSEDI